MTLRAVFRLIRCLSFRRTWNLLCVCASYIVSGVIRRPVVWGMPYTVTIEPTNRCNLQCPECPSGNGAMTRPLGSMTMERFAALVDAIHRETFYLQLFFQGEPFINTRLVDMIRYARGKRMYVAVSTNAHFITQEMAHRLLDAGLDRLIVSIDGVTEESYREYRVGGSLAKVLDGLEHLAAARAARTHAANMDVDLQFLVTRQNEGEISLLHELGRRFDARPVLKTIQVYSLEAAEHFLPRNEAYRRYLIVDDALVTKNRMHDHCARLWERSVITWDGIVVPCCFDKNALYPLGDIRELGFAEIWRSNAYREFRARILRGRKEIPMCRNCTEGLRVYR
jgi:radical SAM protein with 4Fe4S-binding SPASM domain